MKKISISFQIYFYQISKIMITWILGKLIDLIFGFLKENIFVKKVFNMQRMESAKKMYYGERKIKEIHFAVSRKGRNLSRR